MDRTEISSLPFPDRVYGSHSVFEFAHEWEAQVITEHE